MSGQDNRPDSPQDDRPNSEQADRPDKRKDDRPVGKQDVSPESGQEDRPDSERDRRPVDVPPRRRFPRWLAWAAGVVAVVIIGGFVTLKVLLPPEKLRALVVPELEARVGREVQLSAVRLRLFPRIAVRLEEFSIANAPQFGPEPLVELDAVELQVRLWPLIRKQVELRQVRLLGPVIRYQVLADGTSNFEGLGPAARGEQALGGVAALPDSAVAPLPDSAVAPATGDVQESAQPGGAEAAAAAFVVEDLVVRDGQLFYSDGRSGRGASLSLEGRMSAVPESEARERIRSEGKFEFALIQALAPKLGADSFPLPDMGIEYEAVADLYGDSLALSRIDAEVGGVRLEGNGAVRGLRGGRSIEFAMESGEIDIAEFLMGLPAAVRPAGVEASGRARLLLQASGPVGDGAVPDIDGTLDLENVRGAYGQYGRLLADGSGQATFDAKSMSLPAFTGELLDRPFELQLNVQNFKEPMTQGRFRGDFDLARLAEFRADAPPTEGFVEVDLRFAGPVKEPGSLEVTGPVKLSEFSYQSPALAVPAQIDSVTVQLTGAGVRAEEVPIKLGSSDLTVSLSSDGLLQAMLSRDTARQPALVEFRARSRLLDWSEIRADTGTIGYSHLVAARLAGRNLDGRDPREIAAGRYSVPSLPPVNAQGQVQIVEFLNPPTRVQNASFAVVLQDGVLVVDELESQVYGGRLTGGLSLDLGQGDPPFQLEYDLKLTAAQAGTFLERWTRLGSLLTGVVDFDIAGTSSIDEAFLPTPEAVVAAGHATFSEGHFGDFGVARALADKFKLGADYVSTFKDMGGAFKIEDGAFVLEDWEYSAEGWEAGIGGSAGLGGTLDLRLAAQLPPSMLDQASVLAGGSVLGGLVNELSGDEPLEVVVGVGGTMTDPTLQVDADALQSELERRLEGTSKDLLRRLFRRPPPD